MTSLPPTRSTLSVQKPGLTGREVGHTSFAAVVAMSCFLVLRHGMGLDNTLGLVAGVYGSFVLALVIARVQYPAVPSRPASPVRTRPRARIGATAPPASRPQTVTAFTETPTMQPPTVGVPVVVDLTQPIPLVGHTADEPTGVFDLPTAPSPEDADQPRRRQVVTVDAVAEFGFAALGALAVAWTVRVLWSQHSILGTTLWWYAAFLGISYLLVTSKSGAEAALDHVMLIVVWSSGIVVAALLGWMIVFLVAKGISLLRLGFFTHDLSDVGPLNPGGGALHAIIGTLEQVGIATIVVVPISVLTAVYLNEMKGRLSKPVRYITDALSGLPSVVAGLLVFTVWVNGRGYSGFAAALALIVLMIPTVTRTSEEILRTIPDSLREASLALGAPQWRVVMGVVIPTALSGLVTAVILGIARAVGETAPMLLTALGSDNTNTNPFHGPQSDLPLFVWKLIRVPNKTQNARAWAGMLVLVILVVVLFVTARLIAGRGMKKLGRAR